MRLLGFIVLITAFDFSQGHQITPLHQRKKPTPKLSTSGLQPLKSSTRNESNLPKRRILEGPEPYLCATRQIHEIFDDKGYWYSWKDSSNNEERDWLDGRNFCRKRCMDLVSLETSIENEYIKSKIVEDQQKYIWTSGRLCDFKGCKGRKDLEPIAINGWFWSDQLKKLAPTTNREQNDWSPSGGIKKPQPDNREFHEGGPMESCLAVLNNFYGDGIHWHDVACHHRKPFICEDSESLLDYVRLTNPGLQL